MPCKMIEIRNHGKEAARKWFRTHFEALRIASKGNDDISASWPFVATSPRTRTFTTHAASGLRMQESAQSLIRMMPTNCSFWIRLHA